MKRHLLVPIVLILACSAAILLGLPFNKPKKLGGPFSLPSADGTMWSTKSALGKLSIVYFGFTRCPDVCPVTLHNVKTYLGLLDKNFPEKVQVIFVSVDHKTDTSKTADEFAKSVHKSYLGLSGTKEQIDQIMNQYKTTYLFEQQKESKLGYTVLHSNRIFIHNKNGEILDSLILEKNSQKEFINIIKNNI